MPVAKKICASWGEVFFMIDQIQGGLYCDERVTGGVVPVRIGDWVKKATPPAYKY